MNIILKYGSVAIVALAASALPATEHTTAGPGTVVAAGPGTHMTAIPVASL